MAKPTKVCPRCEEDKPWSEFYARFKDENGRMVKPQTYCIPCAQIKRREWGDANKDHERKKRRENYRVKKVIDPEWLERKRAYDREMKQRYQADPVKRAAKVQYQNEYRKHKRRTDPEWAARETERNREHKKRSAERLRQDPAWMERVRKRNRDYQRTRYHSDPEYRQRVLEHQSFYYFRGRERVRGLGSPDMGGERLPIEPFREWLSEYIKAHADPDARLVSQIPEPLYAQVASALGLDDPSSAARRVYAWLNENDSIPLGKADAILTELDSPARLYELWPHLAEAAA